MATSDQVKALIRSHTEGDDTWFYAIAMQVAVQAARTGHGKFAVELRGLVAHARWRARPVEPVRGPRPVPLLQPRGDLVGLLTVSYPRIRPNDMALGDAQLAKTRRVLTEQRERERILARGFAPMRTLLPCCPTAHEPLPSFIRHQTEKALPFAATLELISDRHLSRARRQRHWSRRDIRFAGLDTVLL